jgi:hypothetical protein
MAALHRTGLAKRTVWFDFHGDHTALHPEGFPQNGMDLIPMCSKEAGTVQREKIHQVQFTLLRKCVTGNAAFYVLRSHIDIFCHSNDLFS